MRTLFIILLTLSVTSCYKGRYEDALEENRILTENYLALSAEVDMLRVEVLRLEADNDELRAIIADLEARVNDPETKAYVEELKMEIERQATVILELEQQIADQLDINDETIDLLEELLVNANAEYEALKVEILALQNTINVLNAENANMEQVIADLAALVEYYVDQIQILNAQISEMQLDLEDRDNTIADLEDVIERMQGQIDRLVKLIEDYLNGRGNGNGNNGNGNGNGNGGGNNGNGNGNGGN